MAGLSERPKHSGIKVPRCIQETEKAGGPPRVEESWFCSNPLAEAGIFYFDNRVQISGRIVSKGEK